MAKGCVKCGACCRNSILEIEHLDVVREPKLLEHTILLNKGFVEWESDWEKQYALPSPCPFLIDNQCSIYPTRPNLCVGFDPDCDHEDYGSKDQHELYRKMDKRRQEAKGE